MSRVATGPEARIVDVNAVTLVTCDMRRAVQFYRSMGFPLASGGEDAEFTTFSLASTHLNLISRSGAERSWWGRIIFHVDDVDAVHARACAAGFVPLTAPRDAEWGERYFHILDPDGHELSFAKPLEP